MKAIHRKILLATIAGMAFQSHFFMGGGGLAYAADNVKPSASSGNEVTASDSSFSVNGTTTTSGGEYEGVYGGGDEANSAESTGNTVTFSSGTADGIFGGMSTAGNVHGNTINFRGGTATGGIIGGVAYFPYDSTSTAGNVYDNVVNVSGGTLNFVSGGETAFSYPTGSSITDFSDSRFQSGDVYNNTVKITGGTITNGVVGGSSLTGKAYGNTIDISGGTISGIVVGGEVRHFTDGYSSVYGNTINISGTPDLSGAYFIGGMRDISGASYTPVAGDNTLNINGANLTVRGIDFDSFGSVNFNAPVSLANGGNIITVTDNFSGVDDLSKLHFKIDGSSRLDTGDVVNLVVNGTSTASSADVVEGPAADGSYNTTLSKGSTLLYDLNLASSADGVTATVGDARMSPNPIPDVHKVVFPVIPHYPPDPFTGMATDQAFEDDEASAIANAYALGGFSVFLHTGGGRIKTKTGGGTHVTTRNGNYDLGFARSLETENGKFYIAPIFEYVHGNYDSVLPDDIKGDGSSKYYAGGVIARKINKSGFYYEGSLRGGKVKNDFASNDFVIDGNKTRVTYDMSAPIFTGHLRLGNMNRMNKNNLLEIYGIYSFVHQNGMDTTLSSGDHVDFSSINSHSMRLGYRMTTKTSTISRIYTGLAYQYDTASDSTATAPKYSKTSDGPSGSSGMLELGWQIKPLKENPWMLDVKAVGWTGHHQGFNVLAKVQKSF